MNAAIIGVTGYSGTVLYQLLSQHPAVVWSSRYCRTALFK